jgi:radical SAM-linked protein
MSVQRLRVCFAKRERVRYISHLDVLRHWERAIRRAGLPLTYSQGFTPHPKLQFAGPLPLGYLADREIVDVGLDERVDTEDAEERLAAQTVPDLPVLGVEEVALSAPPPQNSLLWADYTVDVPGLDFDVARRAAAEFMERDAFEWTEERREKERTFDLRAATPALAAEPLAGGGSRLAMRLSATTDLMTRPESVLAAVFGGAEAATITRAGLVFESTSPAHEAWRRRGRFVE